MKIDWYYRGNAIDVGTSEHGHTVSRAVGTNRVHRIYSLNEKRGAMSVAREYGIRATSRKLDIPYATLRRWVTDGMEAEQGGNHHPDSGPKGCRECGVKVNTWFDTRVGSKAVRVWMCPDCWAESWERDSVRRRDQSFFASMHVAVRTA